MGVEVVAVKNTRESARAFLVAIVACMAAVGLGWAAGSGNLVIVALSLVSVGCVAFAINKSSGATFLVLSGFVAIMGAGSVYISATDTAISSLLRIGGTILLMLASLRVRADEADRELGRDIVHRLLPFLVAVFFVYLIVATLLHGQTVEFILYGAGLVLLTLAFTVTVSAIPLAVTARALTLALTAVLATSLFTGVTLPSSALAGGRLRGVTANANTLGFYAFLLGALAAIAITNRIMRMSLLFLVLVTLVWTGSRASALAFVIVLIVVLCRNFSARTIIVGFFLLVAGSVVAVRWPVAATLLRTVTRTNDSRSSSYEIALAAFHASPWIGVGMGNESAEIASSPLRAVTDAGAFGLVAVVVMWFLIGRTARSRGLPVFGFVLAAIIHSLFEGWLLSPVSPLLLMFFITLGVIVKRSAVTVRGKAESGTRAFRHTRRPAFTIT